MQNPMPSDINMIYLLFGVCWCVCSWGFTLWRWCNMLYIFFFWLNCFGPFGLYNDLDVCCMYSLKGQVLEAWILKPLFLCLFCIIFWDIFISCFFLSMFQFQMFLLLLYFNFCSPFHCLNVAIFFLIEIFFFIFSHSRLLRF